MSVKEAKNLSKNTQKKFSTQVQSESIHVEKPKSEALK